MIFDVNLPQIEFVIPLTIIFKMALSILIGMIIGKERKRYDKPGGTRTFALICFGSCLIAMLSIKLKEMGYNFDFVRLLSYGIASIGFVGSGVIIKNRDKIEGITTASSMFALVPTGFFVGMGYYIIAICSTLFIYFLLESKQVKRRK